MKTEIVSRMVQPISDHSRPNVLERVKVTVGFTYNPVPDKRETVPTGWYIFERTPVSWSVIEEIRWITVEELNLLITKYKEDKQLPDNLSEAIETLILKAKKSTSKKTKSELFDMGQEWADNYHRKAGSKVFNHIN